MFRVYGAKGGCQGLSQHLTTKDMLGIVVLATKEIFFNGLDVEQVDNFLQNLVHGHFDHVLTAHSINHPLGRWGIVPEFCHFFCRGMGGSEILRA